MAVNVTMRGSDAFLQLLADANVRYLFGNPGSTELPLMDSLVDHPRIQFVLGLQEIPVMAMADGYAQASRSVGVVNLHAGCGLGNAMGMLYNAYRAGTPLIVTAGQQDRRLKFGEPVLWSNTVDVARQWTKWSVEIERVEDIPAAVRRAMQTALTPPTGPVFLSMPVDVLSEKAEFDLTPPRPIDVRHRPPVEALRRAVQVLAEAEKPLLLAGSRVVESDGVSELVDVAEQLGATVISESPTSHGRLGFPCDHPLYAGASPVWSPDIRARLNDFDVALLVGFDLQLYIYYEPARPFPESMRLVQLDANPWEIGKNYPVEVGLAGDIKSALTELAGLLRQTLSEDARRKAQQRRKKRAHERETEQAALRARHAKERHQRPLTPLTLMSSLAASLPDNAAVIEEAPTTTNNYLERLGAIKDPAGYFAHRGWALGYGLGCALGVKLAWPHRPVLCVLGEGSSLYGIQGLWTAARYQIPVTFVICNNAQYQILKVCGAAMDLPRAAQGRFEGMDLIEPEVDFVALARSFGVAAKRLSDPDEITQQVRESLAGDRPQLFDAPISRRPPADIVS